MNEMSVYQAFIAVSRYARFDTIKHRRETWNETVERLIDFWRGQALPGIDEALLNEIRGSIVNLDVMPSMRSLMTAGEALRRSNAASYNCSFAAITGSGPMVELWDSKLAELGFEEPIKVKIHMPIVFDELFFLLLCGCGTGFSVERQFINDLPKVGKPLSRAIYKRTKANYPGVAREELSSFNVTKNIIIVADSKYGWASTLRIFIIEMYNGNFGVKINTDLVRPVGQPLKIFGGRSSGPTALIKMLEEVRSVFKAANGRKLTSIECHDIVCYIAAAVVVGGVRRASTISLSNLSDLRMKEAKMGAWYVENSQRSLANNSVAYSEKPTIGPFMNEWLALYDSRSGERGIFNRYVAQKEATERGRDGSKIVGLNPCSEILLRDKGFCNLSEIIVRKNDTLETLKDKARIATILGTMQATLTDFEYLSKQWKENAEDERLLGVSMTGPMDHPILSFVNDEARRWLRELSAYIIEVNKEWANKFHIHPAAAARAIKPSGTVSQLVNSASGIHSRFAPYYIRRVRADEKDPLATTMKLQGFPCEPDVMQPSTLVFSFPIKSPEGAVCRNDLTAIEQLEYWRMWKTEYTDHNPSVTISVREHEWLAVGSWVYEHFDQIIGISFLPYSDHIYQQAPYEEITKEEYEKLLVKMPTHIDYEALSKLEHEDHTTGSQEYACTAAGGCDI